MLTKFFVWTKLETKTKLRPLVTATWGLRRHLDTHHTHSQARMFFDIAQNRFFSTVLKDSRKIHEFFQGCWGPNRFSGFVIALPRTRRSGRKQSHSCCSWSTRHVGAFRVNRLARFLGIRKRALNSAKTCLLVFKFKTPFFRSLIKWSSREHVQDLLIFVHPLYQHIFSSDIYWFWTFVTRDIYHHPGKWHFTRSLKQQKNLVLVRLNMNWPSVQNCTACSSKEHWNKETTVVEWSGSSHQ